MRCPVAFAGPSAWFRFPRSESHTVNNNFASYVRHNSIHDSYQRAATIHATNYYTVEDNFAFNVFGHTIFVGALCFAWQLPCDYFLREIKTPAPRDRGRD